MLITLLRAGICNGKIDEKTINSIDEKNLESLYTVGQKHDVTHIVADVLFKHKLMPDCDISGLYKYCSMMALIRYQQLSSELKQLCDLFEENAIPHIPLKGSVIRDFYPEQWYRTNCDIDILVKTEDLQSAADLMENKLGYKLHCKHSHDWGFFSVNGIHVELHFSLIETNNVSKKQERHRWDASFLKDVWDFCVPADKFNYRYCMSNEFFYCYHVVHMAKHFEHGGCGVRSFIDMWILKNIVGYDTDEVNKILSKSGLDKFNNISTKLCDVWFSNTLPDKVAMAISDYILKGGVYGSKENLVAVHQNKKGGKLRYMMSRIFIPYEFLKYQYPVLQRHKWLTPICQAMRWFKLLANGKLRSSVNELKINSSLSMTDRDEMAMLLKELGI